MAESEVTRTEEDEILAVLEDDVFGEPTEPRAFTDNVNNFGCGKS